MLCEDKHCTCNPLNVYFASDRVDRDSMQLYLEIRRGFVKRRMRRGRDDPTTQIKSQYGFFLHKTQMKQEKEDKHLWLRDTFDRSRPVPMRLAGHDDGLGATRRCGTSTVWVVVHSQAHGDNFGFHLANGGEDVGMKRVGNAVL